MVSMILYTLHLMIFCQQKEFEISVSVAKEFILEKNYRGALKPSRSEPCPIDDIWGTIAEICVVS